MPKPRGNERDEGFGLVELVIAILLLGLISMALIPALYNGIRYSATQATTATATRQLNAFVEQARKTRACIDLSNAVAPHTYNDGANQVFTTSGTLTPALPGGGSSCPTVTVEHLTITAKDSDGTTIATVDALVYLP